MAYIIQSSEITRSSGAEYETKALLYLMNFRDDSEEIHYFIIDFFNDLTGTDRFSNKLWDVQSKGAKNNSPKAIGQELVTLYKNYISQLHFDYYILFLGGVTSSLRKDVSCNIFGIENIKESALIKLKEGLKEECRSKEYIPDDQINDTKINRFLDKISFVIDDKTKSEYVKSIIKVNPLIIPDNIILEQIFDQIRDAQSAKKNTPKVEGMLINDVADFIYYDRHIKASEIKMMVLNRLVNHNVMEKGITPSFISIYSRFPESKKREMLEDCQLNIARVLFDKSNAENFWKLFEHIYKTLFISADITVDKVYELLDKNVLSKIHFFDMLSLKYFIAIIKDGMYEN